MKKRAWCIVICLVCIASIGGMLFFFFHPSCTRAKNRLMFCCTVLSLNEGKSAFLEQLVLFKWDAMYVFSSHTTNEKIENALGFPPEDSAIAQSEHEGNLVFVKDDEIVCRVIGASDLLKLQFLLDETEDGYMVIRSDEFGWRYWFFVEDGVRYLKPVKQIIYYD